MRYLLYTLLFFSIGLIYGQEKITGNPFIKNFKPQEYNAHVQNWDIAVDPRGIIYIANGDGLLEYDGLEWKLYQLPDQVTARSVEIDPNGQIYVGGVGEFGLFVPDSSGSLVYRSLLAKIDSQDHGFTDVWDIYQTSDAVFFRANEAVFRYSDEKVSVFTPDYQFNGGFVYKDRFFIQDKGHDLHEITGDSSIHIIIQDYPLNKRLYETVKYSEDENILLFDDSIYLFNLNDSSNQLDYFSLEADSYLKENLGYSLNKVDSSTYAIGMKLDGGMFLINEEGKTVQKIDKTKGLQRGAVYSMSMDHQGNLWMAMSNGISMAEIGTPIVYWDDQNGLNGSVEDIIEYDNNIYVATHQGIFRLEGSNAVQIGELGTQCWSFLDFEIPEQKTSKLVVSTHDGLYEINDNALEKICWDDNIYNLVQSKFENNQLILGLENGILYLRHDQDGWGKCLKVQGLEAEIRSIHEISSDELWLSTYRKGVIRVKLSKDKREVKSLKTYKKEAGFKTLKNIMIYPVGNRLLFVSDKGVYRYDQAEDKFIVDTLLGQKFQASKQGIYAFHESPKGDILFSGLNNRKDFIGYGKRTGEYQYNLLLKPFLRIPEMMVLATYIDDNNRAWIGGSSGLYRFDPDLYTSDLNNFRTYIRKVLLNEDSVIFHGNFYNPLNDKKYFTTEQNMNFVPEISYSNNSITFYFTSNNYIDSKNNLYSYYLEGFDKGWSDWKKSLAKQYTNLQKGTYIFHVRSKNIYNDVTPETIYKFSIAPPWYLTIWAYIGYFLVGFLIIYLILKIYTWRLKAANVHLEELVRKRTKKIETQKEEILSQSEQLAETNRELEKLSIVARETDNAVLIVNPEGEIEWINEGFTRLYGYNLKELAERGTDIFNLSEKSGIREKFNNCIENKQSVIYETFNTTKRRKGIWTQTTLTPILDNEGKLIKLIAIDTDISRLKKAEEEIKEQKKKIEDQNFELEKHRHHLENLVEQRTEDLKKAKEQAEESDRLKSAFLANMSHEIRTPMNAIIGFTNMLNDPEIDQLMKKELMNQITYSGYSLLNLIDNIIDLAKIDANQLHIKKKETEVNDVLNTLYESFLETISAKGLQFEFKPGIDDITVINTDAYRLKQILTNLLENAIKFTEKGSIKLGYNLSKEDAMITFFVKDTGIGIPHEKVDTIFDRFTKIEDNNEKLYRGTGLGLSISKILVEKLGGTIWVDSELEKGSTFYFRLPTK